MTRRCLSVYAAVMTALLASVSHAAPAAANRPAGPSAAGVRLADILREAEENSPEIRAAHAKYEAARTRPSQESALPDPTIGFMATNMGQALPFSTVGEDPQSNAGVSFSQELPFPGKLSLKGGMANQEAKSEFEEYRGTRLEVLSRVKAAYFEYAYLHRAIRILRQNIDSLRRLIRVAQSRYESGGGSQQDVLKAEVEASIARGRLIGIEQRCSAARVRLNALLNRDPDAAVGEPELLQKSVLKVSFEELIKAAKDYSPMLNSREALVERGRLGLDYARRQYYPDIVVGGYYGDSGDYPSMWQWRVDLKVPLYYRAKQRYGVRESEHNLSRARSERDAALQALNAGVKEEYLRARASEKLIDLYGGRIVRDATLAFESSLQSYQAGQIDFLSTVSNLVVARDYQIGYVEELMNLESTLARIEAMVGVPLAQLSGRQR